MDLCRVNPDFNLYDPEWPLRTHQVQAPPAKFVFADEGRRCGQALDSIISAGCIISGSRIAGSVLCPNVRVHSFCTVEQSILMPGVRVGRHAQIRRAIIDRDVFIPRGALIGFNADEDRQRHTVTESGIVVVTTDDEPFIGDISAEALRNEQEFDQRGSGTLMHIRAPHPPTRADGLCTMDAKRHDVHDEQPRQGVHRASSSHRGHRALREIVSTIVLASPIATT